MRLKTPLLIIIGLLLLYQCNSNDPPKAPQVVTREEKIKNSFSYDGAHMGLVERVKANLRDPKSFEHAGTKYTDQESYLDVVMLFRSRNGFGGMNPGMVTAKVDLDGGVMELHFVEGK